MQLMLMLFFVFLFFTHCWDFSRPQVFPVPSVSSTVVGPQSASPPCIPPPCSLGELIYWAWISVPGPSCRAARESCRSGGTSPSAHRSPQNNMGAAGIQSYAREDFSFLNHNNQNVIGHKFHLGLPPQLQPPSHKQTEIHMTGRV